MTGNLTMSGSANLTFANGTTENTAPNAVITWKNNNSAEGLTHTTIADLKTALGISGGGSSSAWWSGANTGGNCNDYTTPGQYSGSWNSNAPVSGYGSLIVTASDTGVGYRQQIFIQESDNSIWIRRRYNSWESWVEILLPSSFEGGVLESIAGFRQDGSVRIPYRMSVDYFIENNNILTSGNAVNQRANLASTSSANSVTASTIGVTGTLPVANGGTGNNRIILDPDAEWNTNGAKTLVLNRKLLWLSMNGSTIPSASPYIDLTDANNSSVLYNSGNFAWAPGISIVILAGGDLSWPENKGSNVEWSAFPNLLLVRWASPATMLDQSNTGRKEHNWQFKSPNATSTSRTVQIDPVTHCFLFLGWVVLPSSVTGGVTSGSNKLFPCFQRICA